ncbi:MAG: PBP1A family penicillin-binding protein [Rhodospirillales bacterium]|nr:PBP1A family penicillin-binding protein [Rhodospirillales bacterium]
MAPPLQAGPRLVPPSDPNSPDRSPNKRGRPEKPRRRRRFSLFAGLIWPLRLLATLVVAALVAGLVIGAYVFERDTANLPSLETLRHYQPKLMTRLYAANDQLQAELATERRIYVPITRIPLVVQQAFIAVEDHNFYEHPGIDPAAILRAAVTDALQFGQHKRPIGASTITQQVAKNMLLNDKVSLRRKIREAVLAMRMERVLSKQQILQLYLNQIYLGEGAYGVGAAALAYFDKPIEKITLPEAAMLASLPKAPAYFDPFLHPRQARIRRDYVLDRMVDNRAITLAQAKAAKAQPVTPVPYTRPRTIAGADYFTDEVRQRLIARFGLKRTETGGLTVHTTLDPRLQALADRALHDGLLAYDRRHPSWRGPVGHIAPPSGAWATAAWAKALAHHPAPPGMLAQWQLGLVVAETPGSATIGLLLDGKPVTAALPLSALGWARHEDAAGNLGPPPRRLADVVVPGDVVMLRVTPPAKGKPLAIALRQIPAISGAILALDPATGRVLAMSGGWNFALSQFDRATQAQRQPGSSFKPMVYLAAMEKNISPSQRFLDAPFVLDMGAAGKWRPGNYENSFGGPTSLHTAIGQSLNLVTVRLAAHIGMRSVARVAEAFGMAKKLPLLLPAALGAIDTTVLREAGAYASLDTLGLKVVPHFIDSVSDRNGRVLWQASGLACQGCNDPTAPPTIVDNHPRIADAQSVFQVVMMMHGVVINGTGGGTQQQFATMLAGKTGTTNNAVDAWFSGFSPDLVTVVWVGFDNPRSLGPNEQGAIAALPIWREFMKGALATRPKLTFTPPAGVTVASWQSAHGPALDAFKPGQAPGVSGPLDTGGQGTASDAAAGATGTAAPASGGVDKSLGGLY